MDNKSTSGNKPSDSTTSRDIAAGGDQLATLLTSGTLGCHVVGLVLSVSPPSHRTGKSAKGNVYDFWTRTTQLFAGPVTGPCVIDEMQDEPSKFPPAPAVGTTATYNPKSARVGQSGILTFSIGD